jgi:O-antigen/teichoic acid export membrane protein
MRALILRGIRWKVLSQVVLQLTRVATAVVLARFLTPHEFGLAAMAIVFSSLVLVFTDIALGAPLVRRKNISEVHLSTIFWASTGIGAALTIAGVLTAGSLAQLYGEPDVEALFTVLSLTFVVTAASTTHRVLLTRAMNFRVLEIRQIIAVLVSAAFGIAVAVRGYGAWAIIAQQVAYASVGSTLLWLTSRWRPQLSFSTRVIREISGFGSNVLGTHVLWYVNRNVDNFLIGKFLGASALGAYAIAYNVILFPLARLGIPIRDVLFPAFSRMQEDKARIADAWLRVNRAVASIAVPMMVGLIIVAPDFVPVVLGQQWDESVPVIRILACVGLLQALQQLNASVLQALDKTHLLFRFAALSFVLSLAAFLIGLNWGIVGVATGYAVANAVLQPLYLWLTARTVGRSLMDVARNLKGVVEASFVMAGVVLCGRILLIRIEVAAASRLALLVVLGVAAFVAACFWRAPGVISDFRQIRPGKPAASAA